MRYHYKRKRRVPKNARKKKQVNVPFEITSVVVMLSPLLRPLRGVGRWEVDWDWDGVVSSSVCGRDPRSKEKDELVKVNYRHGRWTGKGKGERGRRE